MTDIAVLEQYNLRAYNNLFASDKICWILLLGRSSAIAWLLHDYCMTVALDGVISLSVSTQTFSMTVRIYLKRGIHFYKKTC